VLKYGNDTNDDVNGSKSTKVVKTAIVAPTVDKNLVVKNVEKEKDENPTTPSVMVASSSDKAEEQLITNAKN
jgi:hypothetical protein